MTEAVASSPNTNKRKPYQRWTKEQRFKIGKYAAENGPAAAARKFTSEKKQLNESPVRRFCKLYKDEIKQAVKEKRDVKRELNVLLRGRPLLLGSLDQMVQRFLLATRSKGGLISSAIAIATAKALITRCPEYDLGHKDLDSSSWAKSLFKRMGFVKRMSTTGKVEIPEGTKREAELTYLHDIVSLVEKNVIPSCLVINLDQTPLKYIPSARQTLAKKGVKSVSITGSTDKRSITGTFLITLEGNFLPMQLIYGGKAEKSLPRFNFPESFSLSANPKHFSNTAESIKVIEEVVIPYIEKQRQELEKPNQAALLIMDLFRGQMTEEVTSLLHDNNVLLVRVPSNMTHLFQPLDLTVNGHCKAYMKSKFAEWYRKQMENALFQGKKVEEIEISFRLTTIKPLHAKWLMEFYNHITSEGGSKIIINGWKASGIYDVIKMGESALPSIHPFSDIAPLADENISDVQVILPTLDLMENFVNEHHEDDENSEWADENEIDFERNAFDFIIDDE